MSLFITKNKPAPRQTPARPRPRPRPPTLPTPPAPAPPPPNSYTDHRVVSSGSSELHHIMRVKGAKKLDPSSLTPPATLIKNNDEGAPWVLEDGDKSKSKSWTGELEEGQAASYFVFLKTEEGFEAVKVEGWHNFRHKLPYAALTADEADAKLEEQKAKNEEIEDEDEKEKEKDKENEEEDENENEKEKEREQEKVEVKAKMMKKEEEEEEWEEEEDDKWLIKEQDVVQELKKRPGITTRDLIKSFAKKLKKDARNKAILIAMVKKVATPRDGVLVLNKK